MDEYGGALRLHDDNVAPCKSVEDWKADPSVISVTEEGLPPGWVKIVQRQCSGKPKVFFKSPSRPNIR